MIKRALVFPLLIVFGASMVHAQALGQYGCFVEEGGAPFCSTATISCDLVNPANNNLLFGQTVGGVCGVYALCLADVLSWQDTAAAIETNRQEWIAYGNGQAAIVKARNKTISKLRRACGSACKKIK